MGKKYIVALTDEERQDLQKLTSTGTQAAYKINHARILLKADRHRPEGSWSDIEIQKALDVSVRTWLTDKTKKLEDASAQ